MSIMIAKPYGHKQLIRLLTLSFSLDIFLPLSRQLHPDSCKPHTVYISRCANLGKVHFNR